jgi:hypothetical protein
LAVASVAKQRFPKANPPATFRRDHRDRWQQGKPDALIWINATPSAMKERLQNSGPQGF